MFSSTVIPILFSALLFFAPTAWGTCHPNFEGTALTLGAHTLSWAANPAVGAPVLMIPSSQSTEFFFQQNGDDPDVTYTIKTVANNNFAVELNSTSGELVMDNVDWSGSNANQKWTVECTTCATDISQKKGVVASGCSVASHTNGLCTRSYRIGSPMVLVPCGSWEEVDFSV
ncbi:hypothetical protein DFS33DRAFT_129843 [Desarmillaria ectypa]|nr:hypothetical protein DFS33DRAFT_129843 [Desarmillaria ectypa]